MDIIAGTRTLIISGNECNVVIMKSLVYLGTLLMHIITGTRALVVSGCECYVIIKSLAYPGTLLMVITSTSE